MQLTRYPVAADPTLTVFSFVSISPERAITKIVQFSPVWLPGYRIPAGPTAATSQGLAYNLGFGDRDPADGTVKDRVVSGNGDRDKVLATVAAVAYNYCQRHPQRWVFARGSTPVRTRLYQIGLNRFYLDIVDEFELYGFTNHIWEVFRPNVNYDAFLIRLK